MASFEAAEASTGRGAHSERSPPALDPIELATRIPLPFLRRCRIPRDLGAVQCRAGEVPGREVGIAQEKVEAIWRSVEQLYRAGAHPAIGLCIRHRGAVVIDRESVTRRETPPTIRRTRGGSRSRRIRPSVSSPPPRRSTRW